MVDPTTTNVLLSVPTRGSDPGTWDLPVNGNSIALDGYFGGVATISLASSPVTLTAPAGAPTPGAGPYQSQNRTLKFTGTLSANCTVTLSLPGEYTIINQTVGAFIVIFRAVAAGNVVSTPSGSIMKVWCDGTDVYLIKNAIPGSLTFLGGVSAVPAWIAACSVLPFLYCDGTASYSITTYPGLGNLYGSTFGGNGITTFGVEDLRGRVPIAYDGTGTRITVAGCGINGQTLGATLDQQTVALVEANLAQHYHGVFLNDPGHNHGYTKPGNTGNTGGGGAFGNTPVGDTTQNNTTGITVRDTTGGGGTANRTATAGSGTGHNNVQPSQVAGIWLVAT